LIMGDYSLATILVAYLFAHQTLYLDLCVFF
jgi:hypothetical protein